MSDKEIYDYLVEHSFVVDAQDCIMKVLNTSYQITDSDYDLTTNMMTLTTPENIFTFKWKLHNPQEENEND